MDYTSGDGKFFLPIQKAPEPLPPPPPFPFTEEERLAGIRALSAYKRAFGGILLLDEPHFDGMEASERKKYINFSKEYERLKNE